MEDRLIRLVESLVLAVVSFFSLQTFNIPSNVSLAFCLVIVVLGTLDILRSLIFRWTGIVLIIACFAKLLPQFNFDINDGKKFYHSVVNLITQNQQNLSSQPSQVGLQGQQNQQNLSSQPSQTDQQSLQTQQYMPTQPSQAVQPIPLVK